MNVVKKATTPTPEVTATPTPVATPTPLSEAQVQLAESLVSSAPLIAVTNIPVYSENAYVELNYNVPTFTDDQLSSTSFEYYSDLDELGRASICVASVGQDLMPTEELGTIGMVKPTGWHSVKYEGVIDNDYLYDRCRLIGYQLTGEKANKNDLITGTQYLIAEGMLPFENQVADYIKSTNNHVMYRVTPVYDGTNLLASGVAIEAKSVEDNGEGIQFYVYCYNVQPNISIDYATGESSLIESTPDPTPTSTPTPEGVATPEPTIEAAATPEPTVEAVEEPAVNTFTYIINTSTGKFHNPSCSSVSQMSDSNKWEYTGTRDDVISMGYSPCQRCNP